VDKYGATAGRPSVNRRKRRIPGSRLPGARGRTLWRMVAGRFAPHVVRTHDPAHGARTMSSAELGVRKDRAKAFGLKDPKTGKTAGRVFLFNFKYM